MEEHVGKIWHRLITRAASKEHDDAAVALKEMRTTVGVMFRALGGDGGLKVEAANATDQNARRTLLQRIAGTQEQVELAWRDEETLRLPMRIALFPDTALNRDLYLWLAAMAAADEPGRANGNWISHQQALVQQTLECFPGLMPRYQRLIEAQIALRKEPKELSGEEAAAEQSIRQALTQPGSVEEMPWARFAPQPVYLWLHPAPPGVTAQDAPADDDEGDPEPNKDSESKDAEQQRKYQAERVEMPDGEEGLLAMRMETIFSWSEYIKTNRTTDDEEDDSAETIANDMDVLSIARDQESVASRLRFDLDLPSAQYDDLPLSEGILLPEWDYRKQHMVDDYCRVIPMLSRDATVGELPDHLRRTARRLRGQFEGLVQQRTWFRGETDGSEIDLDAWMQFMSDRAQGAVGQEMGLYRDFRRGNRDLSCLLLADLSLSTDAAVNNDARVIDVIRDSLYLFSEALESTGDRFAMYGFSSRKRDNVRFHMLKMFRDRYNASVRGRIEVIKPGYYTRMGAAIRYSTKLLLEQPANRQLLLILTDGKPNDLDKYEGRHGIEDTRMALHEARQEGLFPFCVTIDKEANAYLPHLFGPAGYVVIRRPEELPYQLPMLYARLTA
ncbi:MAG TPA: nitric oxide reductase [Gammaproteobacteria bacterium]|nr:nitric oxide reductase [Gammaproteobacteria bacterium]